MENSDEFNREVGGWVGGAVVEEIMYVLSRWAGDQFNLISCEEKQEGLHSNIYLGREESAYNGHRQIGDNS